MAFQTFLGPSLSWTWFAVSVVLVLLTLWPLVEAARHRRWVWFWAIVALGPLAGLAWLVERRGAPLQRMDERVYGRRGLAWIAGVVALLLFAGTVVLLVSGEWGMAAVYAGMTAWVSYWAYQRRAALRTTPADS